MAKLFCCLRIRAIKSSAQARATTLHGKRLAPDLHHVDDRRTHLNRSGTQFTTDDGTTDALDVTQNLYLSRMEQGAKLRGGAAIGTEILLIASPEFFRPDRPDAAGQFLIDRVEAFLALSLQWAEAMFGLGLACWRLDLDEATPHVSLFIVPVHWSNTRDPKLWVSHRKRFGASRKLLSDWQTDYAEAMAPLGLERGIPVELTGVRHVTRQTYRLVSAILGEEEAKRRFGSANQTDAFDIVDGLAAGEPEDFADDASPTLPIKHAAPAEAAVQDDSGEVAETSVASHGPALNDEETAAPSIEPSATEPSEPPTNQTAPGFDDDDTWFDEVLKEQAERRQEAERQAAKRLEEGAQARAESRKRQDQWIEETALLTRGRTPWREREQEFARKVAKDE